jgi:hypothetical protein
MRMGTAGLVAATFGVVAFCAALECGVAVPFVVAGDAASDVDALIAKLVGADAKASARAGDALVALGAAAVPSLTSALADRPVAARVVVLETLGRIAADHDEAVAPLTSSLADTDPDVREAAALGLLAAGPRAKSSGPALVKTLGDRFANVRLAAAAAAIRSGFSGANGVARTTLDDGSADKDALVRVAALNLLARTDMPAALMRPSIVVAMKDADAGVRLVAIPLLVATSRAEPERGQAITRFAEFPDDPSDACRSAAIRALVEMNAKDDRVIAAFRRDLADHPADREALVAAIPKLSDKPVPEALKFGGWLRGDRVARREAARKGADKTTEAAVTAALDWLARHQSPDGSWSADKFDAACKQNRCDGPGRAQFTPGVTGLALLAFLGAGETQSTGPHQEVVARGLAYLRGVQADDGRIGYIGDSAKYKHRVTMTRFDGARFVPEPQEICETDGCIYDHAIATVALCEAFMLSGDATVGDAAKKAVSFALKTKNPYLAWRYASPPDGDNDTSITGWMCWAIATARASGVETGKSVLSDAVAWIEKMTEPEFGRTGYQTRGGPSSRLVEMSAMFPSDKSESLTAIGAMARVFAGHKPKDDEFIVKGADLLAKKLPKWDRDSGCIDFYYWFWGSAAMRQVGGEHWQKWNDAVKKALVGIQRVEKDRCERGSWDPVDCWSQLGGRIYSTAMCCMALEAEWRMDSAIAVK